MSDTQKVYNPKNLNDLKKIVAAYAGSIRFIAGATDLLVQGKDWSNADVLIDLSGVREITQKIDIRETGIRIGAAVPLSDIIAHAMINIKFPMLAESCRQIGSVQIQNRATLGGNIANASPAGDTLPVLAVYDAKILYGPGDSKEYHSRSVQEIMQGPGKTGLAEYQYIAFIDIPFPQQKNQMWYFRKVGMRHAMAISKVSLAILAWKEKNIITDIRICAGSVSPRIERAGKTENIIRGRGLDDAIIEKAGKKIIDEIDPIDDIRSTRSYRRRTCQALLIEALIKFRHSR